jgi:hypothetical protein
MDPQPHLNQDQPQGSQGFKERLQNLAETVFHFFSRKYKQPTQHSLGQTQYRMLHDLRDEKNFDSKTVNKKE